MSIILIVLSCLGVIWVGVFIKDVLVSFLPN